MTITGVPLLARAELRLQSGSNRNLFLEIAASGITIFPTGSASGKSVFDALDTSRNSLATGRISLASLPASPRDSFTITSLTCSGGAFTLTVAGPDPFCQRSNFQLQNLNLTLSARSSGGGVTVTGAVTLVLFQQPVVLTPVIDSSGHLLFRASTQGNVQCSVGPLDASGLEIGILEDRWGGLQTLYPCFEDGEILIHDFAKSGQPVDLVRNPPTSGLGAQTDVVLQGGRLVADPTQVLLNQRSTTVRSAGVAAALLQTVRDSAELTVEAFIQPGSLLPGIAPPIVSLSTDDQNRCFALFQEANSGHAQASWRISDSSQEITLSGPAALSTSSPSCMVLTRRATGDSALFVNGIRVATAAAAGNLAWLSNYQISLVNSPSGTQPWAGQVFRIAIYNAARADDFVRDSYYPLARVSSEGILHASGQFAIDAQAARASSLPRFSGDVFVRGEEPPPGAAATAFVLVGHVELFPDWSPIRVSADVTATVGVSGDTALEGHASATLQNFDLFHVSLQGAAGRLALSGTWLGNALNLTAIERAGEIVLQANGVRVTLPSSTIPPVRDPVTGRVLSGTLAVDNLQIALDIELSTAGFFAIGNTTYEWLDDAGTRHILSAPAFEILEPPPTRNALAALAHEQIRSHATQTFADLLVHAEDYYFQQGAASAILLHGAGTNASPKSVVTSMPSLYSPDLTATVTSPGPSPIFTLAKTPTGYDLTVDTATAKPDDIRAAYMAFLSNLELDGSAPTLRAGAAEMIKLRIAERLPLPIDQALFYYYGFDGSRRIVDLQPGMRLRVDYEHYQLVHPSERVALDGYVGGGSVFYQVSSSLAGDTSLAYALSFDQFLDKVQVRVSSDTAGVGAASTIDLQQPALRRRYFRLAYPAQIQGPGARGLTGTERVATVIGADTMAALESATKQFVDSGSITEPNAISFSFRGRATLTPEIAIFIGEQQLYVSIGTTVRQLIERFGSMPVAGLTGQNLSSYRGRLRPLRLIHDGPNSDASYKYINFSNYAAFVSSDIFDLPVVGGDRFFF